MNKRYLIVDIDGTVSNASHREELAQAGKWDEFHEQSGGDVPYPDIVDILRHISHLTLVGCTGRNEKYRQRTFDWLLSHNLMLDHLLMRPDNDFTKDVELKIRLLEGFFGSKELVISNVLAVFEDRDRVVEGLREYGLTVLQPRAGAY